MSAREPFNRTPEIERSSDEAVILSELSRHAMKTPDLCHVTGIPPRRVQAAVEELRRRGIPIVGDADGMHLAASVAEFEAYLASYDRRLLTMLRNRSAMRRLLRRMRADAAGVEPLELWTAA